MTLKKIYEMGLLTNNTEIYVRKGSRVNLLAYGHWHDDNIQNYAHHDLESFTWQDDNEFYIDLMSEKSIQM